MNDTPRMIVTMMIAICLSGLAIGFVSSHSRKRMQEQDSYVTRKVAQRFLPTDIRLFPADSTTEGNFWLCKHNETVIGYAFADSCTGYNGTIRFIIALSFDGKILGLSIADHSETPGLGSRILEQRAQPYVWNYLFNKNVEPPWFLKQFIGLRIDTAITMAQKNEWYTLAEADREQLLRSNNVTAVTGATVSGNRIVQILNKNREYYRSLITRLTPDTAMVQAIPPDSGQIDESKVEYFNPRLQKRKPFKN